MVISLRPGKFYGSSLPRPRFHTDVRFNTERVDPPVPVLDPLLSWASEAHWSMGGLSFNRLRLQGRIEGNVERLRVERERIVRKQGKLSAFPEDVRGSTGKRRAAGSPSPPQAPVAVKRRRYMAMVEEEDESEEEVDEKVMVEDEDQDDDTDEEEADEMEEPVRVANKKKPARKLYEEFNSVADKKPSEDGNRAGGHELMKMVPDLNGEHPERGETEGSLNKGKKVGQGGGLSSRTRTSPRLAKAVETSPGPRTRSSRRLVKRG